MPDSGTPAAIGFSQQSGIPYAMGIIRNQYMGRTFIEPTEQIRNMGVRLKLNVNRALIRGKRVILVDDSVVRGTTSRKIKEMILDAGAAEVHFRIASPAHRLALLLRRRHAAAREAAGRHDERGRDARPSGRRQPALHLARRALPRGGRGAGAATRAQPQYCDACFSGDYPVAPTDQIEKGFRAEGRGVAGGGRGLRGHRAPSPAAVRPGGAPQVPHGTAFPRPAAAL